MQTALFTNDTALHTTLLLQFDNLKMDMPVVWTTGNKLAKVAAKHKRHHQLTRLAKFVCEAYGITVDDLRSSLHSHDLVLVREVFTYLALSCYQYQAIEVARYLNRRHRMGTYYFKEVRKRMKLDSVLHDEVKNLQQLWLETAAKQAA